MKREIDWWRGVPVAGRIGFQYGARGRDYTLDAEWVSYRYEHLGARVSGQTGEGDEKAFYASKMTGCKDLETGEPVADLVAWAQEHVSGPPTLVPDPSDNGLTIGLIYRQRHSRAGVREQRYVVRPKAIAFGDDGQVRYLGGGSLTEESADGQLNWERRFDDPSRFVAFYDRDTGEIIDDVRSWLTQRADAAGERIYGINV